jgi:exopolysaccharide production protein ExoQ
MLRKIFNFLEYIFTIASLILYTGGIVNVIATDGMSEGDLDVGGAATDSSKFAIVKILYPITYLIALLLLSRTTGKSSKLSIIILKNFPVVLLVGLAVLSTVWSELPEMTISRSFALVGTTIFGIYLANRYSLRQQLVLLSHTFLAIICLSIVFMVALPQYGLMGGIHAGAARGIYTHKNEFGRLISLGAIVFLMQPKYSVDLALIDRDLGAKSLERFRSFPAANLRASSSSKVDPIAPVEKKKNFFQYLVIYIGLGLAILLMVLSKSSGAIVNFAVVTMFLAFFKIEQLQFHQKFIALVGVITLSAIAATVIVPNPDILFTSMGKSSDLTGRDDIWGILLDLLSRNPLLGFGYGAFWEKYRPLVASAAGWNVPDAHNGFLDLTMSVGLLGLTFFAIGYLYTFFKSFTKFFQTKTDENIYPVILLVYIFISNISETGLFTCNNIFWLLYTTISCSVALSSQKTVLIAPKSPFA